MGFRCYSSNSAALTILQCLLLRCVIALASLLTALIVAFALGATLLYKQKEFYKIIQSRSSNQINVTKLLVLAGLLVNSITICSTCIPI